jgi:short-subunit dehydrogenase
VLITGASRGIGEAIAERAAAAGATVALVARSTGAITALAERLGGTAHPADLTHPDEVATLVERVEADAGPVDVLVNNAGVENAGDVLAADPEAADALYRLNLLAPIRLTRDLVPRMLDRGAGHVVNVSSMASVVTTPGLVDYATSKAALSRFTAGLELELRGLPVAFTTVEIGPVPTDMLAHLSDHAPTEAAFRRLGRLQLIIDVDRVDVADAVVEAVEHERHRVRLPRRAAPFAALAEVPQQVANVLLRGIHPRAR